MNILKSYDFPVAIRADKGIVTENMIKDYFKKHKKDQPIQKYANFYFLLYLSKVIDLDVSIFNFRLPSIMQNKLLKKKLTEKCLNRFSLLL
jgi:hypothetical protein